MLIESHYMEGTTPDGPVVFSGSPTNIIVSMIVFEEYGRFKKK
jgi:hypothetical protein